jgi:hypothetical protein
VDEKPETAPEGQSTTEIVARSARAYADTLEGIIHASEPMSRRASEISATLDRMSLPTREAMAKSAEAQKRLLVMADRLRQPVGGVLGVDRAALADIVAAPSQEVLALEALRTTMADQADLLREQIAATTRIATLQEAGAQDAKSIREWTKVNVALTVAIAMATFVNVAVAILHP